MTMGVALGPFLAGWTAMMAAMMLPSALPMIRVFARLVAGDAPHPRFRTAVFVSAYLVVWVAAGVAVWLAGPLVDMIVMAELQRQLVAATLLVAGAYQLTPLKRACLRAMDFLVTHWYTGLAGALRLGIAHGWYCVGCCWVLMALFVLAGAMDVVWAAAIAAVVFTEKVLPRGEAIGRVAGALLIVAGLGQIVRQEEAWRSRRPGA